MVQWVRAVTMQAWWPEFVPQGLSSDFYTCVMIHKGAICPPTKIKLKNNCCNNWFMKNCKHWVGVMAWSAKGLPCKNEDLVLDSQNPCERSWVWWHVPILSELGRQRQEYLYGFLARQFSRIGELQAQLKAITKKIIKWIRNEEEMWCWPLASTLVSMNTYACMDTLPTQTVKFIWLGKKCMLSREHVYTWEPLNLCI